MKMQTWVTVPGLLVVSGFKFPLGHSCSAYCLFNICSQLFYKQELYDCIQMRFCLVISMHPTLHLVSIGIAIVVIIIASLYKYTSVMIYHRRTSLSEQHTDLLCTQQDLSHTSRFVDESSPKIARCRIRMPTARTATLSVTTYA